MAAQQRLHVLVQHEAAPHHPAVAEHEREQPDDPLGSRLVGKDRAEMGEIDLRLTAGRVSKRISKPAAGRGRTWRRKSFSAVYPPAYPSSRSSRYSRLPVSSGTAAMRSRR